MPGGVWALDLNEINIWYFQHRESVHHEAAFASYSSSGVCDGIECLSAIEEESRTVQHCPGRSNGRSCKEVFVESII